MSDSKLGFPLTYAQKERVIEFLFNRAPHIIAEHVDGYTDYVKEFLAETKDFLLKALMVEQMERQDQETFTQFMLDKCRKAGD